MSYPVTLTIRTDPPDLLERLREAPRSVPRAIARTMDEQNQLTIGHITAQRMTGKGPFPADQGKLGVKTGRLRRSLRATRAYVEGTTIISAIGTNVVYMGVHEFGGQTLPHTIRPRKKAALRFVIGGRTVLARSVRHPGSTFPARRPIYRGIEDREENYGRAITAAALQALGGGPAPNLPGGGGAR